MLCVHLLSSLYAFFGFWVNVTALVAMAKFACAIFASLQVVWLIPPSIPIVMVGFIFLNSAILFSGVLMNCCPLYPGCTVIISAISACIAVSSTFVCGLYAIPAFIPFSLIISNVSTEFFVASLCMISSFAPILANFST